MEHCGGQAGDAQAAYHSRGRGSRGAQHQLGNPAWFIRASSRRGKKRGGLSLQSKGRASAPGQAVTSTVIQSWKRQRYFHGRRGNHALYCTSLRKARLPAPPIDQVHQ
jgi:hypothetical protein